MFGNTSAKAFCSWPIGGNHKCHKCVSKNTVDRISPKLIYMLWGQVFIKISSATDVNIGMFTSLLTSFVVINQVCAWSHMFFKKQ